MGPAYYVIAILGCGEAEAPCQQIGTTNAVYESVAACTAATDDALLSHSDASYPVVVAQCTSGRSVLSGEVQPGEIKLPEGEGKPQLRRAVFNDPRPLKG